MIRVLSIFLGAIIVLGLYMGRSGLQEAKVPAPDPNTAQGKIAKDLQWQKFRRVIFAKGCEKLFLDRGLDLKCEAARDDLTELIISGPIVNRVFVHQFMGGRKTLKDMRDAGFTRLSFWNGKMGDGFTEDYDLTPHPRDQDQRAHGSGDKSKTATSSGRGSKP